MCANQPPSSPGATSVAQPLEPISAALRQSRAPFLFHAAQMESIPVSVYLSIYIYIYISIYIDIYNCIQRIQL